MDIVASQVDFDKSKPRKLGTADDVAELCNLPRATVYEYARRGILPGSVRIGRAVRFRMNEIEKWLESGGESGNDR